MKVEFEIDYRDMADAFWLGSHSAKLYRHHWFVFIVWHVVVAGIAATSVGVFTDDLLKSALVFLTIFVLCVFLYRPPTKKHAAATFQSVYGTRPRRMAVASTEEGLEIESETYRLLMYWREVEEMRETDDAVYFLYYSRTGLKIPKSAFAESTDLGQFLAFSKARIGSRDELIEA